jgi:hypothetical protein
MMHRTLAAAASFLLAVASVDGFAPATPSSPLPRLATSNAHTVETGSLSTIRQKAATAIATFGIALTIMASPAVADGQTKDFKFPPIIGSDENRCVLKGGSSMGQANAARDKLYDLRQCKLSGANAVGYDLSGVSK